MSVRERPRHFTGALRDPQWRAARYGSLRETRWGSLRLPELVRLPELLRLRESLSLLWEDFLFS